MTPPPPHDQRHIWLCYQVVGYTEEIVHDFEQRLQTIFNRQVNRAHILDFEGLTSDMRQDLAKRMRMISTRDDGHEAPEKVTTTDLFFLCSMDRGTPNIPYLLVQYFFRHTEGRKSDVRLSRGHFVRRLAHHFGLMQHVVAAGTPEAAKDAPAVDEGAQADQAPVQVPQPPPPPPATGRTMPYRLGRLKEDIQRLREDVKSLRRLIERLMVDQGRVSTWMISCMMQLIKASGQTYQAFDGTFRGSSPAIFERRTIQRTGEAITSAAPRQPDL
nr:hypothetical protein [Tanacetum cinerariifolium]